MASESKSRRAARRAEATARKKAAHVSGGSWRDVLSMDSERSARLLVIGGVMLVVLIALGFLGFGYWYSVIRPRNRTVLGADGINVSYSAMERRMGYEYLQSTTYQKSPTILAEATYQTVLNEITIVSHAESDLGVTLSNDEFQAALLTRVGVASDAGGRAFADALKKQLDATGLHEDEYRRMVRAETLQNKVAEKFRGEVPATLTQAKVEVIETASQDDANKALARVKGGEEWAAVAKEVSTESTAKSTGGLHDYTPEGLLDPTYDSFAFTAKAGDISAPLSTGGDQPQFFIVHVVDRSDQPVKDTDKPRVATKRFSDWLTSTQETMHVRKDWDQQAQTDALKWVGSNIVPKLIKQEQQQAAQTATAQQPQPTAAAPQQQAPASPSNQGGGANPQAPSQPVAPGGNGQ